MSNPESIGATLSPVLLLDFLQASYLAKSPARVKIIVLLTRDFDPTLLHFTSEAMS